MAETPMLGTLRTTGSPEALSRQRSQHLRKTIKDPAEVKQNTAAIFKVLLGKSKESKAKRFQKANPDDLSLDLELPTDIQSDGVANERSDVDLNSFKFFAQGNDGAGDDVGVAIAQSGPSSPLARGAPRMDDPSALDEQPQQPDEDRSELYEEIATILGNIGDRFATEFETDALIRQEMLECAKSAAKQAAYKLFEKTIDTLLDSHRGLLPDGSERTQVAFVFLCMKTALTIAHKSFTPIGIDDRLLNNAVEYVGVRFPNWIGTAID